MTRMDEKVLIEYDWLNACHNINFAQRVLHSQFPDVIIPYLKQFQKKSEIICCGIQVIHDSCNHWIMASRIGCDTGKVNWYDSLYTHVNEQTKVVIISDLQKQEGTKDFGSFSIAVLIAFIFVKDPSSVHFSQPSMDITCGNASTLHIMLSFLNSDYTLTSFYG